jgi:uncharacterized protein YqjF (DUF2071 family)
MTHPAFESLADLRQARIRQRHALRSGEHRPWPLPEGEWLMGQSWSDLLFAHWHMPPEELRRLVPDALPLDAFEESAWIDVTR